MRQESFWDPFSHHFFCWCCSQEDHQRKERRELNSWWVMRISAVFPKDDPEPKMVQFMEFSSLVSWVGSNYLSSTFSDLFFSRGIKEPTYIFCQK